MKKSKPKPIPTRQVRIDPHLLDEVQAAAEKEHRKLPEQITFILRRWLDSYRDEKEAG